MTRTALFGHCDSVDELRRKFVAVMHVSCVHWFVLLPAKNINIKNTLSTYYIDSHIGSNVPLSQLFHVLKFTAARSCW